MENVRRQRWRQRTLNGHCSYESILERIDGQATINIHITEDNTMADDKNHEGSLGTDRNPPAGTEQVQTEEQQKAVREAELKKRIEELRKRDPFIYR